MSLDLILTINSNPIQKQFLRENSYWYKYLNRSNIYYKDFINDELSKVSNNLYVLSIISLISSPSI